MEENVIQIKNGVMININVSVKKHHICEKDYIWNPVTCSCENGKYLVSIIDDNLVMKCDEIIEETKTIPTNFYETKSTCKTPIFYILLAFLLIAIALSIAVTTYCYLINVKKNKNIYYHLTSQIIN